MENAKPKIEYNFPDLAYAPAPISARIPAVNGNSVSNALALHMNGVRYLGETAATTEKTTAETTAIQQTAPDKLAWMQSPLFRIAQMASVAACAYHGYKRNNSIGWAIWWGICGGGVITPAIAIAQGFGKPIRKKNK